MPNNTSTPASPAKRRGGGRELLYLSRFGKALGGFCAVFMVWYLAVETRLGQLVDDFMMQSLKSWRNSFGGVDKVLLWLVSENMIIVVGVCAFLIVGYRRRWMLGWRILATLLLTLFTAQFLKRDILPRADLGVTYLLPNSFPSGHTAAAVAVAVAFTMAVAPRWRMWFALIGTAWTSLVGIATVLNGWHRLSDVLAAIMIAGCYALLLTPLEGTGAVVGRDLSQIFSTILKVLGWVGVCLCVLIVAWISFHLYAVSPPTGATRLVEWIEIRASQSPADSALSLVAVCSGVIGLCSLALRSIGKLVLRPPRKSSLGLESSDKHNM